MIRDRLTSHEESFSLAEVKTCMWGAETHGRSCRLGLLGLPCLRLLTLDEYESAAEPLQQGRVKSSSR